MKNLLPLLFLVIFTAGISAQETHECSLGKQAYFQKYNILNQVQYPGDKTIDVSYYKLDLTISYSTRQIIGKVTVEGKAVVDNLSDFFLDFQNNLELDSVLYKGNNINSVHSSNKIQIVLGDTLQSGEMFSVDVYYHGTPGSSGFGSFEFGSHNGNPIIWTLSEPYGASDWFPVKDTPADKADSSDVWIRVSSDLVGVSNGTLEEVLDNGDGTKTYKWKNHYPIAQYLISLAITNYELYTNDFVYNDGKDTMKVTHYIFPEDLTSYAKGQLDETVNMLKIFSDKFGLYPFNMEKYGHAQFLWGGGMEHQTITSLVSFGSRLISHELAHQWFGDMITCKDWHHIWLNEGFATYLESVYIEAVSGFHAYKNKMKSVMNSAKNARGSIWVQNINSVGQIFNGSRTYAKGAVVLHMLRGIVGTDKFYEIMKTYANTSGLKYGVATTEDFQAVAEQVSGLDLNKFFQDWIYGELYPIYSVEWGYSNLGNNRFRIDFDIIQEKRGTPRYFSMPVQIRISASAGDSTFTVSTTGKVRESFSIELDGQPSKLELDPNDWILKELRSVTLTSVDDKNLAPDKFSLQQNYPNPFNPATTIKFSIPKIQGSDNQFVKLSVFDLLGNEVKTLINQPMQAGKHSVEFNADNLSSGVYFYSLKYGGLQQTKKMLLLQ